MGEVKNRGWRVENVKGGGVKSLSINKDKGAGSDSLGFGYPDVGYF